MELNQVLLDVLEERLMNLASLGGRSMSEMTKSVNPRQLLFILAHVAHDAQTQHQATRVQSYL